MKVRDMSVENCNNCGACCFEQESPPGYLVILVYGKDMAFCEEDAARFDALPPDVLMELHAYAQHMRDAKEHPNDGVCIWLDGETHKCRHYDLRPEICRETIKVGDEACIGWRELYQIGNVAD